MPSHIGVALGFVCYLSAVFCLFLLPFSQWTASLPVSPVRLFFSNKRSCWISVFFLAFQNVKLVKLLSVTKMKLLGIKFSGSTTIFVAYLSLFPKQNSLGWFTCFLKKEAAPLISVDKCLVCSVSLLITKAKPGKLFQNNGVTCSSSLRGLRINIEPPGNLDRLLGCLAYECLDVELKYLDV